ncbi:LOW QUALITY PROTEIN: eukaryotic translation initiation factor 4E-binding protein 2 [Oncorhynchus mykiss]|uniref:LOW QUALITY PROTEIN: eukaryotic translation initiation factor 4E-binding protein 2 n=1 Tax=Oncorhynchus mykiss TaxID=8022 RepID=UPI00187808BE|nr:LOW QUALITY PROTEIN: eukaryotic translation initiation factor 4E-binding protein 2 [Oncorhynchus mykiss]
MSSVCQETTLTSKSIPTRWVTINDAAHMPHDYSTTPGGTPFTITPGGTRIIYDRQFLLECRTSPLARTPPYSLPDIPGVTSPPSKHITNVKAHNGEPLNNNIVAPADKSAGDDAQFEMDI